MERIKDDLEKSGWRRLEGFPGRDGNVHAIDHDHRIIRIGRRGGEGERLGFKREVNISKLEEENATLRGAVEKLKVVHGEVAALEQRIDTIMKNNAGMLASSTQ